MTLYINGSNGISADNGTWVLNPTTTGTYTLPQKPVFDVMASASVAASAVQSFNTVNVNIGSRFSTSTNRFTAPVTGTYFFSTSSIKSTISTTTVVRMYLRKNGIIIYNNRHYRMSESAVAGYGDGTCSWLVDLNANDYVEVWIGAGATYASTQYTWFNGFYLG